MSFELDRKSPPPTSAEQAYATTLIREFGYEAALSFVEYGVARAQTSNHPVNTLSGLKIYNADFQVAQAALERSRKNDARRAQQRREEADRAAYAAYRRRQVEEFLVSASADLRVQIETEAINRLRARGGIFGQTTNPLAVRLERMALIQERLRLPIFEDWSKDRKAS
jgi:hypothetical protein